MAKVAFIGDSFSAYNQKGQFENHWSWKLAQKFSQHEYFNYALGGRGNYYYQWCLLDAKLREADILFVSRTYNHRIGLLVNDCEFEFKETIVSDNYMSLELMHDRHVWYSPQNNTWDNDGPIFKPRLQKWAKQRNLSLDQAKKIGSVLEEQSASITSQLYNDKWFENITKLYNFKHIIPLELMNIVSKLVIGERVNSGIKKNAFQLLAEAHGIRDCENDIEMNKAGLILSEDDSHLSPKGNDWVLENYILTPDTVNILINSSKENL